MHCHLVLHCKLDLPSERFARGAACPCARVEAHAELLTIEHLPWIVCHKNAHLEHEGCGGGRWWWVADDVMLVA